MKNGQLIVHKTKPFFKFLKISCFIDYVNLIRRESKSSFEIHTTVIASFRKSETEAWHYSIFQMHDAYWTKKRRLKK